MNLLSVLRRASNLEERLQHQRCFRGVAVATDDPAHRRFAQWQQEAAQGDPERFARRLQWAGIDPETALALLTDKAVEHPVEDLGWARALCTLHDHIATPEVTRELEALPLPHGAQRPFSHLIDRICAVVRARLRAQLGGAGTPGAPISPHLSVRAQNDLDGLLARKLAFILIRPLFEQFRTELPLGASLGLLLGVSDEAPSTEHYDRFVEHTVAGQLLPFLDAYPGAARLLGSTVELFEETVVEFLTRLDRDAAALAQLTGAPWSRVASLRGSLSDAHNRGRGVLILELESGARTVYKPKPLALEAAYAALLRWLGDDPRLLPLRGAEVIDRGDYGWVEWIGAAPLASLDEAHRYHQRAGMLMCLFHLFEGNDCHYENVIARGEHPYIIDLETLLQHEMIGVEGDDAPTTAATIAHRQLKTSVLRTGLLPRWFYNAASGLSYDISGLGSRTAQAMTAEARRWQDVNTDGMRLEIAKEAPASIGHNVPVLDGVDLDAATFVADIKAGFERMYEVLIARRQELVDGPLAALRSGEVRMVFRETRVYGQLLHNSFAPEHLLSGVDRSLMFEGLARVFLFCEDQPPDWPVFLAEAEALERGDIPFFAAEAASRTLTKGPRTPLPEYFKSSSYEREATRLERLGPADLAMQTSIIEGCFAARLTEDRAADAALDDAGAPPLSADAIAVEVRRIAEALDRRAFRDPSGGASWIGLTFHPRSERFDLNVIGPDLYDGTAGIALFLGAYQRTTGDARFRALARGCVAPVRALLGEGGARHGAFVRAMGIGGACGLGSIIYVLTHLGPWLDDASLVDDARALSAWMTDEVIAADTSFDVMSGAAGALLALLRVHAVTGDAHALDRAVACGEHLLRHQDEGGWRNFAARPLTGLSHGAAGIAMALAELGQVTGDARHQAAADHGFAYENSLFSSTECNWPDLREGGGGAPRYGMSWCHGAPGGGLARVGAHADAAHRDAALDATCAHGIQAVDSLCCGNVGRAEIAMSSGRALDRPELEARGRRLLDATVARAQRRGAYNWVGNISQAVFVPGFYKGVSGLGYTLLRALDPSLPCVLRWQ